MRLRILVAGFFIVVLSMSAFGISARADTVVLKSGKRVEGKIVEETNAYIAVEQEGTPVYFERKYIDHIDRSEAVPAAPPEPSAQDAPVAVTPAAVTPVVAAPAADDPLEKGLSLAVDGKFDESYEVLNTGLKEDPENPHLAGTLDIVKDVQKGVLSHEFAVNLLEGFSHARKEEYAQAKPYLEKAYQIQPGDTDLNYNLGMVYYELKDYEGSIRCFHKVLESAPADPELLLRLGSAHYMLGNYQQAEEYLKTARLLFQKTGDEESVKSADRILEEMHGSKANTPS